MKLSQLIHAMDRDETIIVNTCRNVPLTKKTFILGLSEEYTRIAILTRDTSNS